MNKGINYKKYTMQPLKFSISINSYPRKIWNILWDKETYTQWTEPFTPGCYYETDGWNEGNKILLLAPNGDGMSSVLYKIIAPYYLAFKHITFVKNEEELPIDDEIKKWSGCIEAYTIYKTEKNCELVVEVDTADEYVEMMQKMFPEALKIVKKIAEN